MMISTFWGQGRVEILGWLPASLLVCVLNKQKRKLRKLLFIAKTGNAIRMKDTIQMEQTSMASFY